MNHIALEKKFDVVIVNPRTSQAPSASSGEEN